MLGNSKYESISSIYIKSSSSTNVTCYKNTYENL